MLNQSGGRQFRTHILDAPGLGDVDLAVTRTLQPTERINLQLRYDVPRGLLPASMFQTSLRIPCRAACLIGSIPRSHACPQSFSLLATAQTALSLAFARTRKSVHSIELNTSLLETRRNNSTSAWSLISLWPFRSSWAAIRCSSFEETATLFISAPAMPSS